MTTIMRAVVVFGALAVANANGEACAADGAKAVDELATTAVDIWSSVKRCEKAGSDLQCSMDITAAIQAANDMIRTIVSSLHDCGVIHVDHVECGAAASRLISAASGLAHASGGLVEACPVPGHTDGIVTHPHALATDLGKCIIDTKGSIRSLVEAGHKMSSVHKNCEEAGQSCTHNALSIVSAMADMGAFLAGAFHSCSAYLSPTGHGNEKAACAEHVLELVASLHDIAEAGDEVSTECKASASRLYEEEKSDTARASSMPLALAALLPISAVLSFVAGSRFAKYRAEQSPVRDFESLQLLEE